MTVDEIAKQAGGIGRLAELLGVHWSTVCGFKRTQRQLIPPHHARVISAALDIPLHEIRPDLWPPPADDEANSRHDAVTA